MQLRRTSVWWGNVEVARAVAAGDELFISYIENETLSFQQRRMALREYGFTCQCARCQHESGESD